MSYWSFNCRTGNHGGCNEFHLGCRCHHHPKAKHLTSAGRYSFIDVDTYPSATVEELETHKFWDAQAYEQERLEEVRASMVRLSKRVTNLKNAAK